MEERYGNDHLYATSAIIIQNMTNKSELTNHVIQHPKYPCSRSLHICIYSIYICIINEDVGVCISVCL